MIVKKMNFRSKIFIICLLISLIPVTILGTFCYQQIRQLLIEREETALTETLIQECISLNNRTDSYINTMNYILWDNSFQNALSQNYTNNFEMYIMYRDILDPLFTTIRALNTDFNQITVYTDNPINPHGSQLRPLSDLYDKIWFSQVNSKQKPFFYVSKENQQMLLIGKIQQTSQPYTNIIVIDINYNKAFDSMETLFEHSYGILLTDEYNNCIYTYYSFNNMDHNYILTSQQLTADTTLNHSYVIRHSNELTNEWTLYLYRPKSTVSAPAKEISHILLMIILLCIVSVILVSSVLSKLLVHPIKLLTQNMKEIEKGQFKISVCYNSNDEIGQLVLGFKHMVEKLSYLIDEVLKSKIAQQKYEMKALQAQINPHFLYNCLSLINGKALMAEQHDISEMAQLLSTFYRTTLNKGKNIITVENEIENIKSYINIQFIMHSYSFDVSYNLDKKTYPFLMINLLLQPLVENAIIHGIDLKESPGRGHLDISCKCSDIDIIFEISDNGPGIPPDKLTNILHSQSNGYGIQNVHHRIQLFYGKKYGLLYESNPGLGTTVKVIIPIQTKEQ